MIRSILIGGVAVLGALAIAAPRAADVEHIKGRGAVSAHKEGEGHDSHGLTMMVNVDVRLGSSPMGLFVFAGEDHDHYPGKVIRIETFQSVMVDGNKAHITGLGTMNGQPVRVEVHIDDKYMGETDHIKVEVFKLTGESAYLRHGPLLRGNIEFKSAQEAVKL